MGHAHVNSGLRRGGAVSQVGNAIVLPGTHGNLAYTPNGNAWLAPVDPVKRGPTGQRVISARSAAPMRGCGGADVHRGCRRRAS